MTYALKIEEVSLELESRFRLVILHTLGLLVLLVSAALVVGVPVRLPVLLAHPAEVCAHARGRRRKIIRRVKVGSRDRKGDASEPPTAWRGR